MDDVYAAWSAVVRRAAPRSSGLIAVRPRAASSTARTRRIRSRRRRRRVADRLTRLAPRQEDASTESDETDADPPEPAPKQGFTLPSAYTILFALIVIMAVATWIIPAGDVRARPGRRADPGHLPRRSRAHPQRILIDSLTAPDQRPLRHRERRGQHQRTTTPATLFGAIDVALFVIVIGGFLGVTMQTGAIQGGIARLVARLKGRERWMIPILMSVFALGGTTFGMAEESLAFYALVIAVMIAAGYDALTGRGTDPARLRDRRPRVDRQPFRHRHRLRLRRRLHHEACSAAWSSSSSGLVIGIVVRDCATPTACEPTRRSRSSTA